MKWFSIEKSSLKNQTVQSIHINGKNICLVQFNDLYFATSNKCPHAGADISQGWCENGHLVCPFHRYKYDLKTGRGIKGQGDYIETYPLKVEETKISIGMKESLFHKWFKS